jgi:septal ring factor EnvC (AmiA/AmiB activator)
MVGLGNAAKKIQKIAETAEDLYAKMNDLRAQMQDLTEQVEQTSDTVDTLEHDLAEQRALIEALAAQQGVDVEQVLADAHIETVEESGAADGTSDAAESTAEAEGAAGGSAAEPED